MPPKTVLADLPLVAAATREEWRQWLLDHHDTAAGVWLVYFKKGSGQPSITWAEAVEEALCFGWIDSKSLTIDAQRYKQVFTPRKPRSVWSKINKASLERLQAAGKMMPAGLRAVEVARQNGSWSAIDSAENLEVPADLAAALAAHETAARHFAALSPSRRKMYLQGLLAMKRPETRARRIALIVQEAALTPPKVRKPGPAATE
ncbi:YdeI/OmpD-associated family protein [Hymenobacter sp. 15J16-1T3B]|uniref:YdeI/OmpD-associated family protein n=1 Tax=Hymenobacter sp. 15J16-1T3B TaxID=2886941 RepID=UPI001D12DC83|nr:YdeI/OmpD-associated family protein [Hymenobacter sp. 15J16-1T3B]MCC3157711.1 YdeI/OmpD-associated family protein [Hymenobacter sp. 15J16-1T3B]